MGDEIVGFRKLTFLEFIAGDRQTVLFNRDLVKDF